jgi:Zn-finger nucleic acid-binding protein
MNWARRLQRVFGIEIDTCVRCGGTLGIIAYLQRTAPPSRGVERSLGARAPPEPSRLL